MYIGELMYGDEAPQVWFSWSSAASWIHSQARSKQPAARTPHASV